MTETLDVREKIACWTLDLEEDLGWETGTLRYETLAHLPALVQDLNALGVPLTLFVAGNLLERQGKCLEPMRLLEFHSHGYWHAPHREAKTPAARTRNIEDGLKVFEDFFGRPTYGYRAPFGILETSDLALLGGRGVKFDSSFFPGFHVSGIRPWRPSRPHFYPEWSIMEIPLTPLPLLRFPYSLSYINLTGSWLYNLPFRLGQAPTPLVFDFHLHDLIPIAGNRKLSPLWRWIYNDSRLSKAKNRMNMLILRLKENGYTFLTMTQLHQRLLAAGKID